MLAIYAVKTEALPPPDELMQRVRLQVGERRNAWQRMPKARATESVAAMLLLQYAVKQQGIVPETCAIGQEENGRPFLTGAEMDFNLSHAEGLAVCAVSASPSTRVGVDVERIGARRAEAIERVSTRWFSEREKDLLCTAADREKTFLQVWTAKEAIVKRSGEGLSQMSKANSIPNADMEYELASYAVEDATVTLCYTKGEIPPSEVLLLLTEDLIG